MHDELQGWLRLFTQTMSRTIFVTGTNTEIGKTLVCKWLCLHWQADYWKPIQSGLDAQTDSEFVAEDTQIKIHPETYRLKQPLSPHESAKLDEISIDLNQFDVPKSKKLIIEGAGGLLVPINERHLMSDLITHLKAPTLLVASSRLGTINHTLLTLQAMALRGISCLGVILSGPDNPSNKQAIEYYGNVKVLAQLPQLEKTDTQSLLSRQLPADLLDALKA